MSSRVSGSDPIGSSEFKLILSDHIHLKCSMHFHHLPTKFFFKTYSEFLLSIRASHYNAREVQPHFCWVQIQNNHQLEPGMIVMVNYNPDDRKERGYWYDAEIQRKRETRTVREIYAKILLG